MEENSRAYVGAQVGTWSYLIPYILAYTGEKEKAAGYFLAGSLVLFGAGRFVSAWLMRFVQPSRLMAVYAVINTALVLIGVFFPGWIGMVLLLCTSFFMSLMYPTIFAQAIRGIGDYAKVGGSIIVMAIVGGAVLTPVMGLISVRFGSMALAYLVPAVAYVAVAFYSVTDLRAGASSVQGKGDGGRPTPAARMGQVDMPAVSRAPQSLHFSVFFHHEASV